MKTPSDKARRAAKRIHACFTRAINDASISLAGRTGEQLMDLADDRWKYASPGPANPPDVRRQATLDEIANIIDQEMELPF